MQLLLNFPWNIYTQIMIVSSFPLTSIYDLSAKNSICPRILCFPSVVLLPGILYVKNEVKPQALRIN